MIRITLAAMLLLFAAQALAGAEIAVCDNCSASKMSRTATDTTNQGTVYVFDRERGTVRKYLVITEVLDLQPRTTWTEAVEQRAEKHLKRAFGDMIEARRSILDDGVIVLPPDFEVSSIAGVMLDPAYATTALESYLTQLNTLRQVQHMVNTLLGSIFKLNIGLVSFKDLFKAVVFVVEFPDGSSMDFELSISINAQDDAGRIELEPHGNAYTADGRAAPTTGSSFRGRTFHDHNGSLEEWILLARSLGLVVRGSSGTSMTCRVEGNVIVCRVKGKR